jgi:hypothetical protein
MFSVCFHKTWVIQKQIMLTLFCNIILLQHVNKTKTVIAVLGMVNVIKGMCIIVSTKVFYVHKLVYNVFLQKINNKTS